DTTREKLGVGDESVAEGPRQVLQYLTRGQLFEVLGTDYNALQSVGAMAQALEQNMMEHLSYLNTLPQPLWVRIQSGEARESACKLRVGADGNVGIILIWSEEATMETVAEALSCALLKRVAVWRW